MFSVISGEKTYEKERNGTGFIFGVTNLRKIVRKNRIIFDFCVFVSAEKNTAHR